MAVELTAISANFLGTGISSTYAAYIYANDDDQIRVSVDGVLKTLGDDYVLNGLGAATGVSIVANFALNSKVFVERVTPIKQEVDTQNNETILEDVLDGALDKLTMIAQEASGKVDRALLAPRDETGLLLPAKASRIGKVLGFDASGLPVMLTQTLAGIPAAVDIPFLMSSVSPFSLNVQSAINIALGVNIKRYGAICDGAYHPLSERFATLIAAQVVYPHATALTDGIDWAAFQSAVNYALSLPRAVEVLVEGIAYLDKSVMVNRPVDGTADELRIRGVGGGASINTAGTVKMFDSTIAAPGDTPVVEHVVFDSVRFSSASYFDTSAVLSEKFLRVGFINCFFWLIRAYNSSAKYAQTMYFNRCNIRNWGGFFVSGLGMYDIKFVGCVIENGTTVLKCYDSPRGVNSCAFTACVIEGLIGRACDVTGVNGFMVSGCYIENNPTLDFNTFAGTQVNGSVLFESNYIYNPNGATIYNGTTTHATSISNTVFPNVLWANANAITNLTSIGDNAVSGAAVHDATYSSYMNGVLRAGGVQDSWTHSHNHFDKGTTGMFGFGRAAVASTRVALAGVDQTNANFAMICYDSAGNAILAARNDRAVVVPALAALAGSGTVRNAVVHTDGTLRLLTQAAAIASPAGGATIDAQSRAAIDAIRAALTNAGITL